jgi:hypothetical protein
MMCDHWWRTVEEAPYGWISICEHCGARESAEHSDACQFGMYRNHMPCVCGAQEEFEKYEAGESRKSRI